MSEDLRIRLTKQMIIDCFIDLLETKPLNKITVVDICANAEINRATFYRYYNNPYDLFESIENWYLESMQSLSSLIMKAIENQSGLFESIVQLLAFFKNNQRVLLAMQTNGEDLSLSNKLMSNTFDFMTSTQGFSYPEISQKQNERLFRYMAHGSSAVIYEWMEDGMRDPIEEVATFLVDCTLGVNEAILWKLKPR